MFDHVIPWEKDLYVNMITQQVEKENEDRKLKEAAKRATRRR